MRKNKVIINFIVKIVLISLVSCIISLGGFLKINKDNEEKDVETMANSIYSIGKDLSKTVNDYIDQIYYEVKLYSFSSSFREMNLQGICQEMNFIKANKDIFNSFVIINEKKELIYGYIESFDEFINSSEVKDVFATKEIQLKESFKNDKYYLEFYVPIMNEERSELLGVFRVKMDLVEINNMLKRMASNCEAYLVNEEGVFLTESKFKPAVVGKEKIDIDKLKLNIDYSRYTPYFDYRNKNVYGAYFPINDDLNWTLVIECDESPISNISKDNKQKISIVTLIQGALLIFLQLILKNFFDVDIKNNSVNNLINNDDVINDKINKLIENINEDNTNESDNKEENNNNKTV